MGDDAMFPSGIRIEVKNKQLCIIMVITQPLVYNKFCNVRICERKYLLLYDNY